MLLVVFLVWLVRVGRRALLGSMAGTAYLCVHKKGPTDTIGRALSYSHLRVSPISPAPPRVLARFHALGARRFPLSLL